MRYIIAGSVAFALVAGIALGFVLRGGAFEAEAKPPPPTGRLIELGTLPSVPNQTVEFPMVDVSDCSQLSAVATVPEPSTALLVVLGLLPLAVAGRRLH